MRISIITLFTICFVNCGNKVEEKNTIQANESQQTEISQNEDKRDYLMPHLKDMDKSSLSFDESTYSSIEDLKEFVEEFRKTEFGEEIKSDLRDKMLVKIDDFINNSHGYNGEEPGVINEFMMPMHEILDHVCKSTDSQMFNSRIDELVNYLNNFAILFPKKEE